MCFDVQVKAPIVTHIIIQVEYRGDVEEAEVSLVVESYVYDLGIGGRFKINDLYRMFDALEPKTIEIVSPDRDVQPEESGIIVAYIFTTKLGAL